MKGRSRRIRQRGLNLHPPRIHRRPKGRKHCMSYYSFFIQVARCRGGKRKTVANPDSWSCKKGEGRKKKKSFGAFAGASFFRLSDSVSASGGRSTRISSLSLSQSCFFFFFFSSILGGGRNRLHQLASWLCCSFHHHIFQILSGGRRREVGPTADRDLLLASLLKLGSLSSLSSLRPQNGRRRKKKKGGGGEIRLKEG